MDLNEFYTFLREQLLGFSEDVKELSKESEHSSVAEVSKDAEKLAGLTLEEIILSISGNSDVTVEELSTAFEHFKDRRDNPNQVTKAQVGLGVVENYEPATVVNLDSTSARSDLYATAKYVADVIVDFWTNQLGNSSVEYNTLDKIISGLEDSLSRVGTLEETKANLEYVDGRLGGHDNAIANLFTTKVDESLFLGFIQDYHLGLADKADKSVFEDYVFTNDNVNFNLRLDLDNHINARNNPNQVTKVQVGLGNVEDLPLADKVTAEAGLSNEHYMTPLRTQEHFTKNMPESALRGEIPLADLESDSSTAQGFITGRRLQKVVGDIITSLALKGASKLDVGTTAGTVAAGDDPRIVKAVQSDTLAQTFGQSNTEVISQKVITDRFEALGTMSDKDVGEQGTEFRTNSQNDIRFAAKSHRHDASDLDGLHSVATSGSYLELEDLPDLSPSSIKTLYETNLNTNVFTDEEKDKLSALETSHFRGVFASEASLISGVPNPTAGNYADVDAGEGSDVVRWIYDSTDSKWIVQSSIEALTANRVKELYEANADVNRLSDDLKSKLVAIAAEATKNATDAQLRARSTHTGTQPVSTITGLHALATSGSYSDLEDLPPLGSMSDKDAGTGNTQFRTNLQNDGRFIAKANLLQTFGQSETIVVSQKAITDRFSLLGTMSELDTGVEDGQFRTNLQNDDRFIAKASIVQTFGQSVTYVLSQKAVTDRFDALGSMADKDAGELGTEFRTNSQNDIRFAAKSHRHSASELDGMHLVSTSGSYSDLEDLPPLGSMSDKSTGVADTQYRTNLQNDERFLAKTNLTQSFGQSSTDVISQKVITDRFDALGSMSDKDAGSLDHQFRTNSQNDIRFASKSHRHSAGELDGLHSVATSGSYNDLVNLPDLTPSAIKVLYETNLDTNVFTDEEKSKLSSLETSHFKGVFVSEAALVAGVTNPVAGNYADVDTGVGSDVVRWIYDSTDSKWIVQSSIEALTANRVKELYEANDDVNRLTDSLKAKLVAIAAGATKNATDSQLRDRGTHTGTQPASTITGLHATATSGSYDDLEDKPNLGSISDKDEGTLGNQFRTNSQNDSRFLAKASLKQTFGQSTTEVISQKAITDRFEALGSMSSLDEGTLPEQFRNNSQNDGRFLAKISLKQTFGQSTTEVISQKAITDRFDSLETAISNLGTGLDESKVSKSTTITYSEGLTGSANFGGNITIKLDLPWLDARYTLNSVTVTGTGYLAGGGDLSTNRAIDLSSDTKTKVDSGATAFSWGNHASAGYVKVDTTYSNGVGLDLTGTKFSVKYGTAAGTAAQGNDSRINNGQTAFSWGNHASAGYVKVDTKYSNGTGLNLTDNAFSVKYGTTAGTAAQGNDSRINNGQTAYSWGNHASAGYIKSYVNTTYSNGVGLDLTGTKFSVKYGTAAGTAAQGNDSRIVGAAQLAYVNTELAKKVDVVSGKGLSDRNYTQAEKTKLASLESSKYRGLFSSLTALNAGVSNPTAGDYADVDAGANSDVSRYIWDASDSKWVVQSGEVASITGAQVKQLYEGQPDTNAYTNSEKSKLSGMATGATKNATDAQLRDRSTHTGTQPVSTITGLGNSALLNVGTASGTVAAGNDSRINNGQTAFGWGNHASAGYIKSYVDTTYSNMSASELSAGTATSARSISAKVLSDWLDGKGYITTYVNTTYSASTGITLTGTAFSVKYGTTAGTAAQGNDSRINNGQTAYSWGDHSSAGYIKSYVDTTYSASTGITLSGTAFSVKYGTAAGTAAQGNDSRINNGQTAFGWGNHASAGYIKSYVDTTYSNMSLSELNGGAQTTARSISSKTLNDWLDGKGYITSYVNTTYSASTGLTLSGTSFSVKYGTAAGTAAQGNDSRINNGQTAFGWGNHADAGYIKSFTNTTYSNGVGLNLNGTNFSVKYGTTAGTAVQGNDERVASSLAGSFISGGSASGGRVKIRLPWNANAGKMLTFDIKVFGNYNHYTLQCSGYLYASTNQWHSTKATLVGSTLDEVEVIFGRDSDGTAYVSIPHLQYMGIQVRNVVGAYTNWTGSGEWTMLVDSTTPNALAAIVAKRPMSLGETLDASKLTGLGNHVTHSYGTTANSVMRGNDSRANNGQTAFGWGNHASAGYVKVNTTYSIMGLAELNAGSATTARTLTAKVLNDWISGKKYSSQTLTAGHNIIISGNVISAADTTSQTLNRNVMSTPATISGVGRYFIKGDGIVTLPNPTSRVDGESIDIRVAVGSTPTLVTPAGLIIGAGGSDTQLELDINAVELVVNAGNYEV